MMGVVIDIDKKGKELKSAGRVGEGLLVREACKGFPKWKIQIWSTSKFVFF